MTALSVYNCQNTTNDMSNKTHTRRVSSTRLRSLLDQLVDELCSAQERVTLAVSSNTFNIHLDDATLNISISQKEGGEL